MCTCMQYTNINDFFVVVTLEFFLIQQTFEPIQLQWLLSSKTFTTNYSIKFVYFYHFIGKFFSSYLVWLLCLNSLSPTFGDAWSSLECFISHGYSVTTSNAIIFEAAETAASVFIWLSKDKIMRHQKEIRFCISW